MFSRAHLTMMLAIIVTCQMMVSCAPFPLPMDKDEATSSYKPGHVQNSGKSISIEGNNARYNEMLEYYKNDPARIAQIKKMRQEGKVERAAEFVKMRKSSQRK